MGTERPKSSLEQAIGLVTAQLQAHPQSLLVVVGPTASGKTALALDLAQHFPIEIISADSKLFYRGMDIGTAKPSLLERQQCPHHLIDSIDPDQAFSVANFQARAMEIINDVLKRGKIPLLAGGTMLYIDSVVYNYQWAEEVINEEIKQKWRAKSLIELQTLANQLRPDLEQWVDTKNPVRLQRILMHYEATGRWLWEDQRKGSKLWPSLIMGLNPGKEILDQRIEKRVKEQWEQGLVKEVKNLLAKYDAQNEAFSAIGYRQVIQFLNGKCSEQEAQDQVIKDTIAYAKRQMTWWKRNREILWL